jgi:hypothetical protein
MRMRWCDVERQLMGVKFPCCDVAWGSYHMDSSEKGISESCYDEPMEKNCINIIEVTHEEDFSPDWNWSSGL